MIGVVAVFVIFILVVVIQSAQQKTNPAALDLNSVRDAMIEKHGWTAERADIARTEYGRFLTLLQMNPGFMLVPWTDAEGRDDLDQFWHQHILDTAKYAADCKAMFGRMIHHNPHVLRGSEQERSAIDKTRRLYARRFGSGTYGAAVDAGDITGCAACSTVPADSGSHSSHGGNDAEAGGHGGHSCGGHSCGHGCGHGCGGH